MQRRGASGGHVAGGSILLPPDTTPGDHSTRDPLRQGHAETVALAEPRCEAPPVGLPQRGEPHAGKRPRGPASGLRFRCSGFKRGATLETRARAQLRDKCLSTPHWGQDKRAWSHSYPLPSRALRDAAALNALHPLPMLSGVRGAHLCQHRVKCCVRHCLGRAGAETWHCHDDLAIAVPPNTCLGDLALNRPLRQRKGRASRKMTNLSL